MTDKTKPCDVTVTVSGDRGSGKSYLIAVLAQALRGAGHTAITQDHIPSALKAITDLSRPYNVTFREQAAEKVEEVVGVLNDAVDEITTLRERVADLEENNEYLLAQVAHLRVVQPERAPALPQAEVDRLITAALTHVRDATIIEQQRHELQRRADDLKAQSRKMHDEAEARGREARAMLFHALTGERPATVNPTLDRMRRQVASRALSAEDKLAIANGADPLHIGAGAAGLIIADSLDEEAHAIADDMAEVAAGGSTDMTMASVIERQLRAVERFPDMRND